jgi:hypothetical protein
MSEHQRLDTSLTSMDWLSRLNTNKNLTDNKIPFSNTNSINSFSFFPNNSNSNSSDSCFNMNKSGSDVDPILIDKLNFSSLSNKPPPLATTTEAVTTTPTSFNSKKPNKQNSINKEPKNENKNNTNALAATTTTCSLVHSSTAQRAEPHRPVDLNAEYKGNDLGRREGKPPYSYVNLITFAINSTTKKRMTLNEIYQWISENFHYYRKAGNGWKVILLSVLHF